MAAEGACYHDELKTKMAKKKALEQQRAKDKVKIQKFEGDLANAQMEIEGVQMKMRDVEKDEAKKLKAANAKGYQKGYYRAAAQYHKDARRMMNH